MVVVAERENNRKSNHQSFEELVVVFPRLRRYVLPELRAAYDENPAGFAYIAREVLREGRRPEALLVWRARHGEHRHVLENLPPGLRPDLSSPHHHQRAVIEECAHGCGKTVCIDDGKSPILCLDCRHECGYEEDAA
jgi:hypothetical protein